MKTLLLSLTLSLLIGGFRGQLARAAADSPAAAETGLATSFSWTVLSPIPIRQSAGASRPDESEQKKLFAEDLLASYGGEAQCHPKPGDKISVNGFDREWKSATPLVDGVVSLNGPDRNDDFQVAYATAEFDVANATSAWLGRIPSSLPMASGSTAHSFTKIGLRVRSKWTRTWCPSRCRPAGTIWC